jgi:predicted kinase
MINEEVFGKIYEQHIKKLKNLDTFNKKGVICFSGIAGFGKTYIAKILEEKYKGVRISNDEIREIISGLIEEEEIDSLTYSYLRWLIQNYKFRNNLIILDSGIDRRYKERFSLFKEKGYQIFIVRLKVSEAVYERRIIEKFGKLDDNYINRIDDWKKQYKEFGENVKSDIIIENEKDNELNLELLYSKLDTLIK